MARLSALQDLSVLVIREQLQWYIGQFTVSNDGKVLSNCNVSSNAWNVNINNGNVNNNNKNNNNRVRPVARVAGGATNRVVYDIPFYSIIRAWINCESNKKKSPSCIKFRWHAARDLVALWEQIRQGQYDPFTSMVFMVTWPVLREVWAGAFRDRIVHHWEADRFGPVLEQFIVKAGDVSMNCRKGYGSRRAIRLMEKMLYDYTEGYTRDDCYIVGGDFANYFMSIDKNLLWSFLYKVMSENYNGDYKDALLYLMHRTLFHKCTDKFFRKSPESMWKDLPPRKSLFYMQGLPIGNLPSQLWANFLGAIFTWWIIKKKGYENFIIFVDDFRVLVRSAEEGKALIAEIRKYLAEQLHITLHPNKIYLQHYTKGTKMVGVVIKPRRIYVANRTRGHFIDTMIRLNKQGKKHLDRVAMLDKVRASINSYLGLMCHYNSYKVRRKIAEKYIIPVWGKYLYFEDEFRKCVLRKEYDTTYQLRKRLRKHRNAAYFIRPTYIADKY
jgi:hypothetical protein